MNILLINPPIRLTKPPYIHPIGLAIIAQMLRDAGHNVTIADINASRTENGSAEFHHLATYSVWRHSPEMKSPRGQIHPFLAIRDEA